MDVFVTGGTGYLGRAMIGVLLNRRHTVRTLTRPTSLDRVPAGATPVVGDALDSATFAAALLTTTTLVHLVGTPHPGPSTFREFAPRGFPSKASRCRLRSAWKGRKPREGPSC